MALTKNQSFLSVLLTLFLDEGNKNEAMTLKGDLMEEL